MSEAIEGLSLNFGPFDLIDTCEDWIEDNEKDISDAIDKAWKDNDHGHNDHSPEDGVGSPQIDGTPNLPKHPGNEHPRHGGASTYTPR